MNYIPECHVVCIYSVQQASYLSVSAIITLPNLSLSSLLYLPRYFFINISIFTTPFSVTNIKKIVKSSKKKNTRSAVQIEA